jgi:hypothetical protein
LRAHKKSKEILAQLKISTSVDDLAVDFKNRIANSHVAAKGIGLTHEHWRDHHHGGTENWNHATMFGSPSTGTNVERDHVTFLLSILGKVFFPLAGDRDFLPTILLKETKQFAAFSQSTNV